LVNVASGFSCFFQVALKELWCGNVERQLNFGTNGDLKRYFLENIPSKSNKVAKKRVIAETPTRWNALVGAFIDVFREKSRSGF
jgi:hypothetical protein